SPRLGWTATPRRCTRSRTGAARTARSSTCTRRSRRTRRRKWRRCGKRSWRRRRREGWALAAPLVLFPRACRSAYLSGARRRSDAVQVRGGCGAGLGVHSPPVDAAHVSEPPVGAPRATLARRAGLARAGARPVDAAVPVDRREHDPAPGRRCRTLALVVPALLRARRELRGDAMVGGAAVARRPGRTSGPRHRGGPPLPSRTAGRRRG